MTTTDLIEATVLFTAIGVILAVMTLIQDAAARRRYRRRAAARPPSQAIPTVAHLQDLLRDDTDRPDFRAHSGDSKADAAYHGWENER